MSDGASPSEATTGSAVAPIREDFDVATMSPSEKGTNTIVLGGVDLVIPLELDLDDDPLQDDEVRLVRADGHFTRTLNASDADVTIDDSSERLIYRFRDVPPGAYSVEARISDDRWASVVDGILVTTKGATWHGQELGADLDAFAPKDDSPEEKLPPRLPRAPEHDFYEFAGDESE